MTPKFVEGRNRLDEMKSNLWQYSYLQFHIAKKKIQYIYSMAEVGSGSNNARSEWLSDNMKQSIFLKSIQYELSIYTLRKIKMHHNILVMKNQSKLWSFFTYQDESSHQNMHKMKPNTWDIPPVKRHRFVICNNLAIIYRLNHSWS